jgi:ADP-ribose pyrophosphatase
MDMNLRVRIARILAKVHEMRIERLSAISLRRLKTEDWKVMLANGQMAKREFPVLGKGVSVIGVTTDGKVIILSKTHVSVEKTFLEVVSGGMEKTETPEQTALREFEEESGFTGTLEKLIPLGDGYTFPVYLDHKDEIFLALDVVPAPSTRKLDPFESCDVEIFTIGEIVELLRDHQFKELRTNAVLARAILFELQKHKPEWIQVDIKVL